MERDDGSGAGTGRFWFPGTYGEPDAAQPSRAQVRSVDGHGTGQVATPSAMPVRLRQEAPVPDQNAAGGLADELRLRQAGNAPQVALIDLMRTEIKLLRAETLRLRKNSDRYQWLRNQPKNSRIDVCFWFRSFVSGTGNSLRGIALDATIDDAME